MRRLTLVLALLGCTEAEPAEPPPAYLDAAEARAWAERVEDARIAVEIAHHERMVELHYAAIIQHSAAMDSLREEGR